MLYHWHELDRASASPADPRCPVIHFDRAAATAAARGAAAAINGAPRTMRAANDTRRDPTTDRLRARGIGLLGHPHHYPNFAGGGTLRHWTMRLNGLMWPMQIFRTLAGLVELLASLTETSSRTGNRAANDSHTMVAVDADDRHCSIGAQQQRLDAAGTR